MKNKNKLKMWEKTLTIAGAIMTIIIIIVCFLMIFNLIIISNQSALAFAIFLVIGLSLFLVGIEKKIFGWTRRK